MKSIVDGAKWNDHLSGAIRAFRLSDLALAERRLDKAFSAAKEDRIELHILAGHIAFAKSAFVEAEKAWRKALEVDPENAEAWNNLGVLYRRKGETEKAMNAFLEAQELAPDRPDIPYNIGNLHKNAGRYDEAVAAYNRAIGIDPDYTPAYNNLGTLYESRKERDKAMEVFRRGLSADRGNPSLRFNMGLAYQDEAKWEEAREAFDSALKSRPGWAPGLNNLGIVLQELGKEDEAARTFRTLLDIEPDNVSALNNLGVAYDRLGRVDDARKCYKKALAEDPSYAKAALNLHDSYHENKELSEALEEINKQITHHPTDPEIRVRMARTLMGLARWDEAEKSLDHVLERDPEHSAALRAKADLLLSASRPKEAEDLLRRLPHDPDSVRDLAKLNLSTDRPSDARRLLEELSSADPDDAESRRILSDLLADTDPEQALVLRKEAAAADPGVVDDLVTMARISGSIGRKDEALGRLDEAVSLLGSRGEAEDLDSMDAVLSLYENAAAALEEEKGDLFSERTLQLGRKLKSTVARQGSSAGRRNRFINEDFSLEEEDALSLLDINSMEPVIRINEEEETVYLDESAEDLEDAYTELDRDEYEEPRYAAPSAPNAPAAPSAEAASAQGPPVHIHLSPQAAQPSPQVIYQDVRSVVSRRQEPEPGTEPVISVSEMPEIEIPEYPEPEEDTAVPEADSVEEYPGELTIDEEDLLEEAPEEPEEEGVTLEIVETEEPLPDEDAYEDDGGFLIPDSDALSEDIPDEALPPELETAPDLIFKSESPGTEDAPFEEYEEDEELVDLEEIPDDEEEEPAEEEVESKEEGLDAERMAGMFRYLTELTDQTSGEGRDRLIKEGVPLKLAGLSAKLSGDPRLRDVAQKYDRRRRERHNIELDEEKITESLSAFKDLAAAYPGGAISESLTQRLGSIMSFVGKIRKPGNADEIKSPAPRDSGSEDSSEGGGSDD